MVAGIRWQLVSARIASRRSPSPAATVARRGVRAATVFRVPREDNGFVHLLRFLGVWLLMAMLFYVIVGYVWMMFALSATGRRKRDILMLLIPVWGTVVGVQTMWRYTAKNVYWSARPDRVSKSLFSG